MIQPTSDHISACRTVKWKTVPPPGLSSVVQQHHWLTPQQFASLFALAQAAPGPNMLVVTLIGWNVAALPGALVTTLGVAGPSSVLTCLGYGLWHRFRDAEWRRLVQRGLMPVTAGLLMASAVLLIQTTSLEWGTAAITAVASLLFLFTRIHPLLVLAMAAALVASGLLV